MVSVQSCGTVEMNRRKFLGLAVGTLAAPFLFVLGLRKLRDPTPDEINELLYFRGLRPCSHSHHSTDEDFARCG